MNIRVLWVHFKTVWFFMSRVRLLAFMFMGFVSLASVNLNIIFGNWNLLFMSGHEVIFGNCLHLAV